MRHTLTAMLFALVLTGCSTSRSVREGEWQLSFDDAVTIRHGRDTIVHNLTAEYRLQGGSTVSSRSYSRRAFRSECISDDFGQGRLWTVTYSDTSRPTLTQHFRIYEDFLLTDITLSSDTTLSTNYMAPIVASTSPGLSSPSGRRALFVPFDNDDWVRFASPLLTEADTVYSYEVTSVYEPQGRQGIVVGSIDHDTWKNAVLLTAHGHHLRAYSGAADRLTRDVNPHGQVGGRRVSSARMMIGSFADWRDGMETFARACATVAPPRPWQKAMPVGWNSWGALAFSVNHDNACRVSDFFASELQSRSFANADGLLYTGLDSGWNSFSEDELRDFADRCRSNHQVPCIYWTPFTDWAKSPDREVDLAGHEGQYHYRDLYLYADGKAQELDGAYALDPPHPAVRAMMEQTHDLFRRCGYAYVKMDFMTHGRMEADRWHLPGITTGTQAYCYGMHLLDSIFSDMYLNLSISPIFPAQYAQSRRIACDAWNKMKDTEYTMNALSYGRWIGGIYRYNDADHVVLRDATEGENRARITSSAITGLYITGDDFSADSLAISRARRFLTNPDINGLATGRPFRPLLGDDERAERAFVRTEPDGTIHLAIFNYGDTPLSLRLSDMPLPLQPQASYRAEELWQHHEVGLTEELTIPSKDACVFRFKKQ